MFVLKTCYINYDIQINMQIYFLTEKKLTFFLSQHFFT